MINWKRKFLVGILLPLFLVNQHPVEGHGRLMEPPNRSSLWRLKEFENRQPEKNYDDNQLWCGGMGSQYNLSGGKCGPCGDAFVNDRPRENENGGKYGRGIITRTYTPGQVIPIGVELTVNHLGYFIFSLCPLQLSPGGEISPEEEECFEKYPLALADGTGTKFLVRSNDTGYYKTSVRLPKDLNNCKLCAIRWHYRTGNRWNYVNNETGALGIGDQEIFRGCSDVTIGSFPADPTTTITPTTVSASTVRPITITPRPTTTTMTTPRPATTTTANFSSQKPIVITGKPFSPRPFPTQRPPSSSNVVLPAAPTVRPSTLPPKGSANQHPPHLHPVMRPPPPPVRTKEQDSSIILPILSDSLPNSL